MRFANLGIRKMKVRWFTPEETSTMACPLSVGQAEAGRYTFCVNKQCMAWTWYKPDDDDRRALETTKEIPANFIAVSAPYEIDGIEYIDIERAPTHGRCGMVLDLRNLKKGE